MVAGFRLPSEKWIVASYLTIFSMIPSFRELNLMLFLPLPNQKPSKINERSIIPIFLDATLVNSRTLRSGTTTLFVLREMSFLHLADSVLGRDGYSTDGEL